MEKVIKIQSVSDIITNSSSEVFMVYDVDGLERIKELVNAVLSLSQLLLPKGRCLSKNI